MDHDDDLPKHYFEEDKELTLDGSPYKKPNYLLRSYVIAPTLFIIFLLVGSAFLLSSLHH